MPHQYELITPSPDLPPGFDPRTHRILAKHWFGVTALPRQVGAAEIETVEIDEAA